MPTSGELFARYMVDGDHILSSTAMSTSSERTTSTSDGREPKHADPTRSWVQDGTKVWAQGPCLGPESTSTHGAGFYLVQRGPWRESIDTRISLTALSPHDPGQDPRAGFSAFEGMPLGVR